MNIAQTRPLFLFIAIAAGLIATEAWIAAQVIGHPGANPVATAIAADLVIGLPLLYYLLLVRQKRVPPLTTLPVFLIAVLSLRLIVPEAHRGHLAWLEGAVLVAELALVCLVAFKIRGIVQHVREAKAQEIYTVDALRSGISLTLKSPLASSVLTAEISILYFAALGWFKQFRLQAPGADAFTYHRKNSLGVVLLAILLLVTVEASLVHLVVLQWSATAAWVLLGLHLYGFAWIAGFYHSARLQPIVLSPLDLHLRTGMLWRAAVPRSSVLKARRAALSDAGRKDVVNLSVLGSPNVVIAVSEPVTVHGCSG